MTPEELLKKLTDYQTKYSDESLARNQDRRTLAEDRTILASLNSRLGEIIAEEREKLRAKKFSLKLSQGLRYKQYRTEGLSGSDAKEYSHLDFSQEEEEIINLVSDVHRMETLSSSVQEMLNALSSHLKVLGNDFRNNTY